MSKPDLRFISWIGFAPSVPYEIGDETWKFETDTVYHGKDERGRDIITINIKLDKPEKCIASRSNAHP